MKSGMGVMGRDAQKNSYLSDPGPEFAIQPLKAQELTVLCR